MNLLIISFSLLLISPASYLCQEESDIKIENERNCRERNRLITTDKGDIYMLVDVLLGDKLILQCHYCKENDDGQPKIWYKMEKLTNSSAQEVKLGMESNSSFNRIRVNTEHSLVIQNATVNDSGFYYCLGLDGQESEHKYNYFVDLVFENETEPEKGNLTAWRKYHDENFAPINKLFTNSTGSDYVYLRETLFLRVEVVTEWERWGPCQICGRPQGDGRRLKKGFCRLKFTPIVQVAELLKIYLRFGSEAIQKSAAYAPIQSVSRSTSTIQYPENCLKAVVRITIPRMNKSVSVTPSDTNEAFLLTVYELSCRSLIMGRAYPAISNITKILPHFIQVEHCEGTCNPDAEGLSKGWKTGKTLGFKYKKSYVLAQDAHLTLVCPESTLENVVRWRKNGKILKAGESVQPSQPEAEPRITVDTFNTLYLHGVTREEEGNYTCEVDDIRMQQVKIFVVSKSRLLTQAFVRHVMYLAFVLSLTLTCYCAGLFITWKRRHTFKSYEELQKLKRKSKHAPDEDDSDYV